MGQRSSRLETEAAPPAHASPFLQCAQPALASALRNNWLATGLGPWPDASKLPIVYSDDYNISFFKLEEMHPFDSKKYRRVVNLLEQKGVLSKSQLVAACEATLGALRNVHAEPYLNKLERSSLKVAQVTELAPLAAVPSFLLRSRVLRPMRLMAGGSVQAGALALERGWAVNLGGGMHHAHYADGGGWCVYDDITLMLRTLRSATGGLFERAMVIDLDVHQGNGVQRSKMHHGGGYNGIGGVNGGINATVRTFIVDVYNPHVYPKDTEAKAAIDVEAHVVSKDNDR